MPRHAPLPFHFYVYADNSFLGPEMPSGTTQAVWHGLYCRPSQAMLSHVLLETGAHWTGLPLQALSATGKFPFTQQELMPWGGMGDEMEAVWMPFLEGMEAVSLRGIEDTGRHTGIVVDWKDGYSRYAQEHKPLSLIALETGQFALLPNNYVMWRDKHFVQEGKREETRRYRRGEDLYWE